MQDQGHGWQPIAYASKVNSSAESNYSITELECLAVVWSVKLFRPYLYGRAFVIITDHSALKWLMTRPNLAGRLHRWSLTLQEYEFTIEYRPGTTNVVADALSRAPAAVRAVVGRKRRPGRPPARTTRTDSAAEAVVPASTVAANERLGASGEGDGSSKGDAQWPTDRPLTRAAKRRQEEAAATALDAHNSLPQLARRTTADGGDDHPPHQHTAGGEQAAMRPPVATMESRTAEATSTATGKGTATVTGGTTAMPATVATAQSSAVSPRSAAPAYDTATRKSGTQPRRTTRAGDAGATRTAPRSTKKRKARRTTDAVEVPASAVTTLGQAGAARTAPGETLDEGDELAPVEPTLQVTDEEVMNAQQHSKLVQRPLQDGKYRGMKIARTYGLVTIETQHGKRVVLPPALWAVIFKEMHGSVWAGHLRGPHTYGRVAQLYWWPRLLREVNRWVRGCQECGSRKARPREVIPPLRSIRGGDVGDRWALDVAGPFPVADGGERYVIAALEYVTRYAVARCVTRHTTESVASFLMEDVVLKFGAFRELLTDGAPEMVGKVIEQLVVLLQAEQTNSVPYRPQMIGLVERFHRSWKDCVSTFMSINVQNVWNLWTAAATQRAPTANGGGGGWQLVPYHERLLLAMERSHACAEAARVKEQERQAHYYNRRVRQKRTFAVGDRVWVYNPPRGPKATKFVHQWQGPMRIVESAGYENFVLEREDKTGAPEVLIAHVSFLVSYHHPESLLQQAASDLKAELDEEDEDEGAGSNGAAAGAPIRTATAARTATAPRATTKRQRGAASSSRAALATSGRLVETRRRRKRNSAGQYGLEHELRPVGRDRSGTGDGGRWWVSTSEFDRLWQDGRVVEDPTVEEVV
ncbi:hypothetical protein PF011_g29019 [Phytophthora fragariae]|uniref:Integrase catalytic domain-containing protein n=1 Tax=Phytophthora fragariae TaxID=53985 RepID=A0A6A3H1W2_9STRA|nr:hypothetical protein PF011_g29019 [Phytophthora fragariae]